MLGGIAGYQWKKYQTQDNLHPRCLLLILESVGLFNLQYSRVQVIRHHYRTQESEHILYGDNVCKLLKKYKNLKIVEFSDTVESPLVQLQFHCFSFFNKKTRRISRCLKLFRESKRKIQAFPNINSNHLKYTLVQYLKNQTDKTRKHGQKRYKIESFLHIKKKRKPHQLHYESPNKAYHAGSRIPDFSSFSESKKRGFKFRLYFWQFNLQNRNEQVIHKPA